MKVHQSYVCYESDGAYYLLRIVIKDGEITSLTQAQPFIVLIVGLCLMVLLALLLQTSLST